MNEILNLPAAGIILSICTYGAGVLFCRKYPLPFVNPLLIGIILTLSVIVLTPMQVEHYQKGSALISFFILPATIVLAVNVYAQREVLRANVAPLLAGCIAGSFVSIISIKMLSALFKLDEALVRSLLPKSVTTAIALELSEKNGGVSSITVVAVIITGISTSLLGPAFIKWFKLKDPVARGCAMGMAGHAIGTARSLQMGSVEGGMAGISLCLAGIITSVMFLFL